MTKVSAPCMHTNHALTILQECGFASDQHSLEPYQHSAGLVAVHADRDQQALAAVAEAGVIAATAWLRKIPSRLAGAEWRRWRTDAAHRVGLCICNAASDMQIRLSSLPASDQCSGSVFPPASEDIRFDHLIFWV